MSTQPAELTEILARYDEQVLAGDAPEIEAFCARYPEHPELRRRLEQLEGVRDELDNLLRDPGPCPEVPESLPGFELLRPLGAGGMGAVYLAQQHAPRRLCAIKFLHGALPSAQDRFRREADLAARLSHPGLATVYSFGVAGDVPYLVTELIHGFSLRDLLRAGDVMANDGEDGWFFDAVRRLSEGEGLVQGGRAPVAPMVRMATEVADALAHAHERGVVHRDVKPSNIIVGLDGRARLIDFGIAVTVEHVDDRLTRTGTFIGSHEYAAPEQLRGEPDNIGPWTDTYALGAALFEMLTQRTPFNFATFTDRLARVEESPPAGPRAFNPKVSAELDQLVMRALHPERDQRFYDGEEIRDALRVCPTEPSWLPPFPSKLVRKAVPRGRAQWLALFALIACAGLAWLWLDAREMTARLRASAEAREMLAAHALLDYAVRDYQSELQTCLLEDPRVRPRREAPRFVADVVVDGGRVTAVGVSDRSVDLGAPSRRCLRDVVTTFELPGIGMGASRLLRLDLRVAPESLGR